MLTLFTAFPASSCSEVIDAFSADQTDVCTIGVSHKAQGGLLFLSSDAQPCGNHYVFTRSVHPVPHRLDHYIFLICSATPPYYANAHCNGFSPIDQI